jgi:two-component system, chemotaxis family, protein-glutamate methylesterase/glutaminase
MDKKISVFVVDDSAVVRQVVSGLLNKDPNIRVIGAAPNPIVAMERMRQEWPDVIVLDVEMPQMDGITFLKLIMQEHPTPVVVCSTLTTKDAETTMQALAAGAFSIITKAKLGIKDFLLDASTDLIEAVKAAAVAKVKNLKPIPDTPASPKLSADVILPTATHAITKTTERIIAIGASAGGTQAVADVLTRLPSVCPGIVMVQHMPEKFTASLAARLNSLCNIEVKEASNGDRVIPGRALIAPGAQHLLVKRSGAQYFVEVMRGPLVNRHCPSVDVLFRSVATHAGKNAMGIIMTGMGNDGAAGLLEMRNRGAYTIAQDEETCVVYGMPKAAVNIGAVEKTVSLPDIPDEIMRFF